MAAKTLFAIAALCAFAAASAIPTFRHIEDIEKQPHLDLQKMALIPGYKVNWANATEVLEKIEEVLENVQIKIQEVAEEVQNAAQSIVDGIEEAALEVANKWNEDVQKWADKAAQAGVDVQECLNQQQSLADVIAAVKTDSEKCAQKSLAELAAAVEDVKSVGPLAKAVIDEAKAQIDECQKKGSFGSISVCLLGAMPRIQIKAAKVVAEATLLAAAATGKAVAVGPVVTVCASSATARHAAEATAIVNNTVECIKAKINAAA